MATNAKLLAELLEADGDVLSSALDNVVSGIDWSSAIQTSSFTAVTHKGYFVDTSSSAITVTLPASPSKGDKVAIVDYAGNAGTNNITLARNGSNVKSNATDGVLKSDYITTQIVYSDATKGWVTAYSANETTTDVVGQQFTMNYLLVGGGGSGGASGGGGAGGMLDTSLTATTGNIYTIEVGAGGNPSSSASGAAMGLSGTATTLSTSTRAAVASSIITAQGGGGGGSGDNAGLAGGSGGGAGSDQVVQTGGAGTAGQGNNGGNSVTNGAGTGFAGGGGGGKGAVGANGSGTNAAGAGGAGGITTIITTAIANSATVGEVDGTNVYFAGGGGGGAYQISGTGTRGLGGLGGGGDGGHNSVNSTAGTANTGGGGGGQGLKSNGTMQGNRLPGASGVAILKIPTTLYSGIYSGADVTLHTDGSNKILIFKSSGTYSA